MTAPVAPARPLALAREEHRRLHAAFMDHATERCRQGCRTGDLCPRGRELRDDADAAGRRWERAQTGKWPTW